MGIPRLKSSSTELEKVDNSKDITDMKAVDVIRRFADRTSMHGCGYIGTSRHWFSRVIWIIITLSAVVVLVVHLYVIITQYLTWPKATKVSLSFNNLRFPAVTVCNFNPIRKSTLNEYGSERLQELISLIDPKSGTPAEDGPKTGPEGPPKNVIDDIDLSQFVDERNPTLLTDSATDDDDWNTDAEPTALMLETFRFLYMQIDRENRSKAGHEFSDMTVSCSFHGRRCFPSNFTLYQTPTYGNCYTLDAPRMVSKEPGPSGGLTLKLYLQTDEFVDGLTNGYGVKVVVHDRGTKPLPEDEGVFVPSASETNIALRQTHITRLGLPYGNCTNGVVFKQKFGLKYTLKMCHVVCLAIRIWKQCGCWYFMHENIALHVTDGDFKICNTVKEGRCQLRFQELYKRKALMCRCKNPCKDIQYDLSVSSRQWPTQPHARLLRSILCKRSPAECEKLPNSDKHRFLNNFMKLNIYYQTLNFESIEEEPLIGTFTFLSSIGGALGLWIGLSLLGVCELLQLGLELITCIVNKIARARGK